MDGEYIFDSVPDNVVRWVVSECRRIAKRNARAKVVEVTTCRNCPYWIGNNANITRISHEYNANITPPTSRSNGEGTLGGHP